jgi:cytosine permease
LPLPEEIQLYTQPAVLYRFIAGFAIYWALAKAGLQPKTVAMAQAA